METKRSGRLKRDVEGPSVRRQIAFNRVFRLRSLRLPVQVAEKLLSPPPDTRAFVDPFRKRKVHTPLHPLVQLYVHLVETEARKGTRCSVAKARFQTESDVCAEKDTLSCMQLFGWDKEAMTREGELREAGGNWRLSLSTGDADRKKGEDGGARRKPRAEGSPASLEREKLRNPWTGGEKVKGMSCWETAQDRSGPGKQKMYNRDQDSVSDAGGLPSPGASLCHDVRTSICDDFEEERLLDVALAWAAKRKQDLLLDLVDIDLILKDLRVHGRGAVSSWEASHSSSQFFFNSYGS